MKTTFANMSKLNAYTYCKVLQDLPRTVPLKSTLRDSYTLLILANLISTLLPTRKSEIILNWDLLLRLHSLHVRPKLNSLIWTLRPRSKIYFVTFHCSHYDLDSIRLCYKERCIDSSINIKRAFAAELGTSAVLNPNRCCNSI